MTPSEALEGTLLRGSLNLYTSDWLFICFGDLRPASRFTGTAPPILGDVCGKPESGKVYGYPWPEAAAVAAIAAAWAEMPCMP